MGYFGRITETERQEFLADEFVEPAVFLEQIIVVKTGNKDDLSDLEPHQFLKRLDTASLYILNP
jgi:hypothetical protein